MERHNAREILTESNRANTNLSTTTLNQLGNGESISSMSVNKGVEGERLWHTTMGYARSIAISIMQSLIVKAVKKPNGSKRRLRLPEHFQPRGKC